MRIAYRLAIAAAVALALAVPATAAAAPQFTWSTVVNNGMDMPPCPDPLAPPVKFNSYNQPSVNEDGLVVLRARSRGGTASGPVHGIYTRDMAAGAPLAVLACRGSAVPQPNNLLYNGLPASLNEFPSIPRIDATSATVATRGQSEPVWEYQVGVDPLTGEPTTTRVGTAGVYTNPGGTLVTGASLLGAVTAFPGGALVFPQYSVPGAAPGTRFDQFPGSPAVTRGSIVAYKGNFTTPDGIGRTGVFFRDAAAAENPTFLVANSFTRIPNQPAGGDVRFGSTAPPSAASGYMYFVGLDNEDAPTLGGIYRARLSPAVAEGLVTLVGIGDQVPGESFGVGFERLGEGLAVTSDGQFVVFWASWGRETFPRTLYCPTDGNAARRAYCNEVHPAGHVAAVPVHQGIFLYDVGRNRLHAIAKSGEHDMEDFLYWVFSGMPPGVGGGHGGEEEVDEEGHEPARWRSSAFASVSVATTGEHVVVFKATQAGVPGIFLRAAATPPVTVVKMFRPGQLVDAAAPADSIVTSVGIEREGLRGHQLAVSVGMLYEDIEESVGWAGIYLSQVRGAPSSVALAAPASPSILGQPLEFTATVSGALGAPTGTVTFVANDAPLAGCTDLPLSGVSASCVASLPFGPDVVTAEYSGDATYLPGSSARHRHGVVMPLELRFTAFDSDGNADLAWRNADGTHSLATLQGLAYAVAGASAGAGMRLVRLGDLDGDGNTDLVWRAADGRHAVQILRGTEAIDSAQVLGPGTGWEVVDKADFDGDGRHDLLWRHASGAYGVWLMDGVSARSYAALAGPGAGYAVKLLADFNGDGRSDVLWQHADGRVSMWLMNGHDASASAELLGAGTGWSPVLSGDLDANGKMDILWQHANGSFGVWIVDGTTLVQYASLLGARTGWSPTHTGDFNGDGKADILWKHEASGAHGLWLMDGPARVAYGPFSGLFRGWSPVEVADHDGDGKEDLVWRHADGRYIVSLMNGLNLAGVGDLHAARGATLIP